MLYIRIARPQHIGSHYTGNSEGIFGVYRFRIKKTITTIVKFRLYGFSEKWLSVLVCSVRIDAAYAVRSKFGPLDEYVFVCVGAMGLFFSRNFFSSARLLRKKNRIFAHFDRIMSVRESKQMITTMYRVCGRTRPEKRTKNEQHQHKYTKIDLSC